MLCRFILHIRCPDVAVAASCINKDSRSFDRRRQDQRRETGAAESANSTRSAGRLVGNQVGQSRTDKNGGGDRGSDGNRPVRSVSRSEKSRYGRNWRTERTRADSIRRLGTERTNQRFLTQLYCTVLLF